MLTFSALSELFSHWGSFDKFSNPDLPHYFIGLQNHRMAWGWKRPQRSFNSNPPATGPLFYPETSWWRRFIPQTRVLHDIKLISADAPSESIGKAQYICGVSKGIHHNQPSSVLSGTGEVMCRVHSPGLWVGGYESIGESRQGSQISKNTSYLRKKIERTRII